MLIIALKVSFWPFSADHDYKAHWSSPMQSVVRTNANDWSNPMQMTGQVECKLVVKWRAISHIDCTIAQSTNVDDRKR